MLPQDGIKATPEGFMLDEGIYDIRAVAVNGDLVSDELRGTWKIIMPSPMTPRATLAPNTYKNRQSVKLKPGLDDERDTSIVIYYTIDGSIPDSDSPIFDGEPIIFMCGSWLLYPGHEEFLPKNLNILRFMHDFEIIESREKENFDDAWRVFGRYADEKPENLPTDTALRRAYAERLRAGKPTGYGVGVIVFITLASAGYLALQRKYRALLLLTIAVSGS